MELVNNILYNGALHHMLKIDFLKLLSFLQQGLIIAVLDFAAICELGVKLVVEVVVGGSGITAGEVVEAFVRIGTRNGTGPIVGGKIPTVVALLLVLGGGDAAVVLYFHGHAVVKDLGELLLEELSGLVPVYLAGIVSDDDVDDGVSGNAALFIGLVQVIKRKLGVVACGVAFCAPGGNHFFHGLAVLGFAVDAGTLAEYTGLGAYVPTGGFHMAKQVLGYGLAVDGVIDSLAVVIAAADGVIGVLAVDIQMEYAVGAVFNKARIVDVGFEGIGIGREYIQLALLPKLNAGVLLGNYAVLYLVIVEVIGHPMVGVLDIGLHGVIGPIREDVRTAAHEVVKVGTVGSGQAVGAEAFVPQGFVAGYVVPVEEVVHNLSSGVYVNGGYLNGVIIDLLYTDVFPIGGYAAFGILHGILLGIHDGDGVAGQEGAHTGHHHGVKLLLKGEHKGVRIDGIAIVPLCILTDLYLPVVIVDLNGLFSGDVADPDVSVAFFVGILTIQIAHAIGGNVANGAINIVKEVEARMVGTEHGIIDLLTLCRGLCYRSVGRGRGLRRCAGVGIVGLHRILRGVGGSACSQQANYEYHGQKQCNGFLHVGFLSFFVLLFFAEAIIGFKFKVKFVRVSFVLNHM